MIQNQSHLQITAFQKKSTFQGYQETKYINQEGIYIANLDPDRHMDMGLIYENGTQAVYGYLNNNFNYAFYTTW